MIRLERTHAIYAMGDGTPPAVWIDSGDTVEVEAGDWFSHARDVARALAASEGGLDINPATGPIGVRGVCPGDTLRIRVKHIELCDRALMFSVPGGGLLGDRVKRTDTRTVSMQDGWARFSDDIRIPLHPMIGVMGTAPLEKTACYLPGPHGGNLDTRQLAAGSVLHLPVFVDGGLLSLGDLHGTMADGETSEWGLETNGTVRIRVDACAGNGLGWPLLETDTDVYLLVSAPTTDEAIERLMEASLALLVRITDLPEEDAIDLLSLVGHLEISQVVNPLHTLRMRFSREVQGLHWERILT